MYAFFIETLFKRLYIVFKRLKFFFIKYFFIYYHFIFNKSIFLNIF